MTNAEARCNKSLRPRKPEGSLGRTAQDVHLDSHTAPVTSEFSSSSSDSSRQKKEDRGRLRLKEEEQEEPKRQTQKQSSYTPNCTAARRNWRRQLHSSCRLDCQCSSDREEEEEEMKDRLRKPDWSRQEEEEEKKKKEEEEEEEENFEVTGF